jgi:hypothetical protein
MEEFFYEWLVVGKSRSTSSITKQNPKIIHEPAVGRSTDSMTMEWYGMLRFMLLLVILLMRGTPPSLLGHPWD